MCTHSFLLEPRFCEKKITVPVVSEVDLEDCCFDSLHKIETLDTQKQSTSREVWGLCPPNSPDVDMRFR